MQLYLDLGERGGACVPLLLLAGCAVQQGDPAAALQYRKDYFQFRPETDDRRLDALADIIWVQLAYLLREFKQMEGIAQAMLDLSRDQNPGNILVSLCFLGVARKRRGEYREASACYLESLGASQGIRDAYELSMELSGLAGIAAQLQQPARAARLFGVVEQLLKTSYRPMDWVIRCEYERDVAAVRRALSAEECSRAWTEGSSMALDEAIQEARALAVELA
jgi:tetratricopeptide (TPR) repeat protein